MTSADELTRSPAEDESTLVEEATRFGLVALTIAGAVSLVSWIATLVVNRNTGLDASDESYYLLVTRYPERNFGMNTDFGFYLRPVLWLGGSIGTLRMFGLCLLVLSAVAVAVALTGWIPRDRGGFLPQAAAIWTSVTVSTVTYYGLWLPTPSYNLMTAACTMFVTACLISTARADRTSLGSRALPIDLSALALGACLTIGAFNKVTAFVVIATISVATLAAVIDRHRIRQTLLSVVVGALAALPVHWLITGLDPVGDLRRLVRGAEYFVLLQGHEASDIFETQFLRTDVLPWFAVLLAVGLLAAAIRRVAGVSSWLVTAVACATFAPLAIDLPRAGQDMLASDAGWWWLRVGSLGLVWITSSAAGASRSLLLGPAVLLLAPASGIGSSNGFIHQVAFTPGPVVAGLLLQALIVTTRSPKRNAAIPMATATVPLALIVLATFGWRAQATDMPYRLDGPLAANTSSIDIEGFGSVRVSPDVARYVAGLQDVAADVDPLARSCVVDLSGSTPLATLALGGRPAGFAWLIGGYAGSLAAADYILDNSPCLDGPAILVEPADGSAPIARPAALDDLTFEEIGRVRFSGFVDQVQVVSVSAGR